MSDNAQHLSIAQQLAAAFALPDEPLEVRVLKGGHINQSLLAIHAHGAYVHQNLNQHVFPNLPALADNVARISDHLQTAWGKARALCVRRTPSGQPCATDDAGHWWRCTDFIANGTMPNPARLEEVLQSARVFAEYSRTLGNLAPKPQDTIVNFHDLPRRIEALRQATTNNAAGRADGVTKELETAFALADDVLALLRDVGHNDLPQRVVHNDAKLANVLLTPAGPIVVDLDTTMLGPLLNDVGELLRTAAHQAEEDEPNLAVVRIEPERHAAIIEGYTQGLNGLATPQELNSFRAAGPYLALENGVRFLSDHLAGDVYFRVHRHNHNLDRARVQLRVTQQLLDLA